VRASFHIAGHILGSSLVLLELEGAGADGKGRRVLFSGDLGHYDQPIIRDPVAPPACDYMLVESTYGDRLHDAEDPKDALARVINEAAERGGPLLVPAFAIGRTQELLYHIRELEDEGRIPILPVRVDSPMAANATQIYQRNRDEHDEEYEALLGQNRHPCARARC
jgi:metallo-beta-lactamase family protein